MRGGGYNAQAQLWLDIFPSQDDTNATLWVFSGSSSGWTHANANPHIRTSGGYDRRDTHKTDNAFLQDPASLTPAANYNLTSLFTATATNSPLDLESLRTRLGQTIQLGTTNTNDDITIPSSATNVPTISYAGRGSRTIAAMHLRNVPNTGWDDIGPRTSSQLTYGSSSRTVTWTGAAVMTNKPIAHFHITTPGSYNGNRTPAAGGFLALGLGRKQIICAFGCMAPSFLSQKNTLWCLACLRWPLFSFISTSNKRNNANNKPKP